VGVSVRAVGVSVRVSVGVNVGVKVLAAVSVKTGTSVGVLVGFTPGPNPKKENWPVKKNQDSTITGIAKSSHTIPSRSFGNRVDSR